MRTRFSLLGACRRSMPRRTELVVVLGAALIATTPLAGQEDIARIPDAAHEALERYTVQPIDEYQQVMLTVVDVEQGASIRAMLLEAGVRPDAESYALVAEINRLEDIDRIRAGSELIVPVAVLADTLAYVVAEAPAVAEYASYLPAQRQAAAALADAVALIESMDVETSGLSTDATELMDELASAGDVLLLELQSDDQLPLEIVAAANSVAEGLHAIAACGSAKDPCIAPVRVHALGSVSGDTLANLRIFAAPLGKVMVDPSCLADKFCGKQFPGVSPNATTNLVVGAQYALWATRNDVPVGSWISFKPARGVTNHVDLQIPEED